LARIRFDNAKELGMDNWKWRRRPVTRRYSQRFLLIRLKSRLTRSPLKEALVVAAIMLVAVFGHHFYSGLGIGNGTIISCAAPRVIDGDTLVCAGKTIRLAGIDAPEMPGHCRHGRSCVAGNPFLARSHLQSLASGEVICRAQKTDPYGRTVARCEAAGNDLSCAMVEAKNAVRRYGTLWCW
jgi:endonuclease YncB( thermonuclease family)